MVLSFCPSCRARCSMLPLPHAPEKSVLCCDVCKIFVNVSSVETFAEILEKTERELVESETVCYQPVTNDDFPP